MKVLVVEDTADVLELMRMTLEVEGYEVLVAASAEEALVVLDGATVDIMLLDVRLPGMDGFELLEELRAREALSSARIIVLSAHASGHMADRARRLGANGYLVKPFSVSHLLNMLANDS